MTKTRGNLAFSTSFPGNVNNVGGNRSRHAKMKSDSSSNLLRMKESHSYNVFRTYHRLIGQPRIFRLPLHCRVHAVFRRKPNDYAYSFDMIPDNATQISTILNVLSGREVPATIRIRRVPWPVRSAIVTRKITGQQVTDFGNVCNFVTDYKGCEPLNIKDDNQDYDCKLKSGECIEVASRMSLYTHNCYNFADDVENFMFASKK